MRSRRRQRKAMGAASSRDENTVDISNLSTCLYISCIVTLIGFLYYSNRESRRKYLRLARSKLHGCKDKLAERRAIRHASNHTPTKRAQSRLLTTARHHVLYICAGLGTTGTSALERALAKLGLRTAKWGHVLDPSISMRPKPSAIMDALLRPSPNFFALFNEVDAVLDSPIVDYLPFLLEAYPNARLILTHRDPHEWAERRSKLHPCSPPPFAAWYGHGALALSGQPQREGRKDIKSRAHACTKTPERVLRHALIAWEAYVESVARHAKRPLLHIDVFAEHDKVLWSKLLRFVEDGTGRLSSTRRRKARGVFGCFTRGCKHTKRNETEGGGWVPALGPRVENRST